ncbi:MAG TPA: cation diffusion facilitator family transporter [Thermoanaerobaculia bacterium]|jgi:cobalt-zinc-cadmium efflux system protein|nr:cation diffusion facilitator family transporter [Thermoanaerobaculia bacterium]
MSAAHSHAGHSHGHSHSHGHAHSHGGGSSRSRLLWTLGLIVLYMVAEAVGGWLTHSLALLADAGHMLSDAAALGLSVFAMSMARRPRTSKQTYGYHRLEILAALANGATLVAISLLVILEAVARFGRPEHVDARGMIGIAAGGLVVNLLSLWILHAGKDENLNMRGAWLHVATDALGTVQAIVAGALILGFGWQWADPVASVLISLLVVYSAWSLLKEATGVLMESAPAHIDVDEVHGALADLPGVLEVHDLHVWTITSGMESISAHVVVEDRRFDCEVLGVIRATLHERFGIHHITVQMETAAFVEHPAPC